MSKISFFYLYYTYIYSKILKFYSIYVEITMRTNFWLEFLRKYYCKKSTKKIDKVQQSQFVIWRVEWKETKNKNARIRTNDVILNGFYQCHLVLQIRPTTKIFDFSQQFQVFETLYSVHRKMQTKKK